MDTDPCANEADVGYLILIQSLTLSRKYAGGPVTLITLLPEESPVGWAYSILWSRNAWKRPALKKMSFESMCEELELSATFSERLRAGCNQKWSECARFFCCYTAFNHLQDMFMILLSPQITKIPPSLSPSLWMVKSSHLNFFISRTSCQSCARGCLNLTVQWASCALSTCIIV